MCYSSDVGLEILAACEWWYADATFSSCSSIFYQLFCIHGWFRNTKLVCVYGLMKKKNFESYKKFLDLLRSSALKLNPSIKLNPSRVTTDFEKAMIKAFEYTFPHIRIAGCWFHYTQCITQKCNNAGFKVRLQSDRSFKLWIDKLYAMSLIPLDRLSEALIDIENSIPDEATCIYDYFVSNWMSSNYPVEIWNHSETIGPKTNNHLEGFHSKITRHLGAAHPNIYKLVKLFKTLESNASVDYESIKFRREALRSRKTKAINKEIQYSYLIKDLKERNISISEFFSQFSLIK